MKRMRSSKAGPTVLAPIFPNAGVQAWYQSQLDALIKKSAAQLVPMVSAAWKKTPPIFSGSHITAAYGDAALAMDAPSPTKALQQALARWGAETIKRFDDVAQRIANDFTDRSQRATQSAMLGQLKKAGFTVKFNATRRSLEAYQVVAAENVGLIRNIPQKWYSEIQTQVWDAVRSGSDLATLSKNLRGTYGMTTRRAALISRDQNAKAKAVIERERQMELGFTRAVWMHSHAGKEPRPTHMAMNNKQYQLAKGMWDRDANGKGKGEWVHPGQLINCRCTSRPILEGYGD